LTHQVIEIKEIEVTMKRLFYIVILLALSPTLVHAFGLGKLDLNSALNEPFDARIQLLSPTADELDSLKINLADSQAFARAKIDRPFILSKLRFDLRRSVDDGPEYIRVYSQDPIREPFLNFLVEVSWSNGRLFREYTVLLDPPLYDPTVRTNEFTQAVESDTSMEAVTIDDPDHKVVYADAYEDFASSTSSYTPTPNVNYTGGDYGPTEGSDTLWSIASKMRPDNSTSVNQMMLALLQANPEAFINQNINNLKRGQILRMPNESEMNSLSNAEALSEAQSQHSTWGNIKDNLSSDVSERPEVSSVSETSPPVSDDSTTTEVVDDPELKLVAADDDGEATEQVSSVDSGSGEELVLAQESIQVLTQENIELKDRVQEADALLEDLKRLLSLKDDELAALQEQMAAAQAEEEMMEEVEEEVAEAEEEMMEEVEEEVAEAEEEMMEEVEEEVAEAEEEMMEEVDEEVIEVIEIEPEAASTDIMGMVNQYIAKVKDILLGNPMIGMAVAGLLVVLIIIVIVLKFRKEPAETLDIDAMTEEFPDFESGDLGDIGEEVDDSEAETVLPDSEAETILPVEEESADFDLDVNEEEDAKTQFMPVEETEELPEEEEDPLQEVNTYLAFEQFDQAEEFVRNVINDDPDNPEYHTKLLEVFYTSGNKKSYEEAAKVLHDKVGGEGEHWNMAIAMWQEMSPNRALFEEGGDDDDAVPDTTGGFVDVTADEESSDNAGDLDFDIGGAEEEPAAASSDTEEEMLDITGSSDGEDLLDVTAAVGLGDDIDSEAETAKPVASDDILDISSTGAEDLLDLTATDESAGDDLLDVTAAANLDLDSEEDLLDVTAATSAGADISELLDIEIEDEKEAEPEENEIEFDVPAESNETVEFDIGVSDEVEASDDDENVLDFDMTSDDEIEISEPEPDADDAGLEIDLDMSSDIELDVSEPESDADDAGLEIDLDLPEEDDNDEPIRLDVEDDASTDIDEEGEISIDLDMGDLDASEDEISLDLDTSSEADDVSLDLDMGDLETTTDADDISLDLDMDDDGGIELDLSVEENNVPEAEESSADVPEIDFDLSLDSTPEELTVAEDDIDLDGTIEIPKAALPSEDDEDDDDDDDHTVFVPRAAQPEEQSSEDEIATKLDLAKAYVELGDKDSAKTILDEVIAEGNDEQKQQAEDLLGQV
jgi:pilus assembly protein FimV